MLPVQYFASEHVHGRLVVIVKSEGPHQPLLNWRAAVLGNTCCLQCETKVRQCILPANQRQDGQC